MRETRRCGALTAAFLGALLWFNDVDLSHALRQALDRQPLSRKGGHGLETFGRLGGTVGRPAATRRTCHGVADYCLDR